LSLSKCDALSLSKCSSSWNNRWALRAAHIPIYYQQAFIVFCVFYHFSIHFCLTDCEFAKFYFLKVREDFLFFLRVGEAYSFTSLGWSDGMCGL
jgi:hypothetical protein